MQDKEIWKPVPSMPGVTASSLGNIKYNGKPRKMHGCRGYLSVSITHKNFRVHRLVAEAFCGPISDVVNHLNGIKSDNRPENLEWCSVAENTRHAWRTGAMEGARKAASVTLTKMHTDGTIKKLEAEGKIHRPKGEENKNSKLTNSQVISIRALCGTLSCTAIANRFGISRQTVRHIRIRRTWKHIS